MSHISNRVPMETHGKSIWYNPVDKINYESDIYHKIWKGPNNRYYHMLEGTVYKKMDSDISYVLREGNWVVVKKTK